MALLFIDRAIEYDQAGALDHDYVMIRAEAWRKLNNNRPIKALLHYNEAARLGEAGDLAEAEARYLEAFRLDPGFLWSLNNLSWSLATTPMSQYLNGPRSQHYATIVCRQSHWNYWAFVSTLAAANARCGLFNRAISCQKRAMHMAPDEQQALLSKQLLLYEQKKPYTAIVDEAVAGDPPDRAPDGTLQ